MTFTKLITGTRAGFILVIELSFCAVVTLSIFLICIVSGFYILFEVLLELKPAAQMFFFFFLIGFCFPCLWYFLFILYSQVS